VWSMAGRNVEGLHAVGDIFIKDKCQLCVKLCVASLFMHFFYGFFLCMLHVYFYYYSV
jgi:hypothetical protein